MIKLLNTDTLHFSYTYYSCVYEVTSYLTFYDWYSAIAGILYTIMNNPQHHTDININTPTGSIAARGTSARQGDGLQWMGVLTVLLTVGVLMISYLPAFLIMFGFGPGVQN